jgi:DNA-3-methyladenine glycosylase II
VSDAAYVEPARRDPVLGDLAEHTGRPDPFAWAGHDRTGDGLFAGLALHLIGQQITIKAALTIYDRPAAAAGARPLLPAAVAALDPGALRGAGLSTAKATAMAGLAGRVTDGTLDLDGMRDVDDDAAAALLTAQPGIGPWTAQMFLVHQLHRPDVFPAGDVGLREAARVAWRLTARPAPAGLARRAAAWTPLRTYAATLLWASLARPGG